MPEKYGVGSQGGGRTPFVEAKVSNLEATSRVGTLSYTRVGESMPTTLP